MSDPARLEQFMGAMTGLSRHQLRGIRRQVRFLAYRSHVRRGRRDRIAQH